MRRKSGSQVPSVVLHRSYVPLLLIDLVSNLN